MCTGHLTVGAIVLVPPVREFLWDTEQTNWEAMSVPFREGMKRWNRIWGNATSTEDPRT